MTKLIRGHLTGIALLSAVAAPLCMLLEVFMDLQQPTLMSDIIDTGVRTGDLAYVLHTGGRMILFALTGLLGGAGCSVFSVYAATHMGGAVRGALFEKVFQLSSREVDRLETSSLVVRMTGDVVQVQDMLAILLRGLSRAPMLFVGAMVMSFVLSPRLAMILVAVLPLLFASAVLIVKWSVPLYTRVQKRLDRVSTVMRENLLGVRVVKAFTLEEEQTARFDEANEALVGDGIRAQSATFLLMPIVTLAMNLSVVAVLWFGGRMEIAGDLPMGRIMAFVNYLLQITNALVMLVSFTANLSRSKASALRIQEVLGARPSVAPPEAPLAPQGAQLEFRGVSFGYSAGERALKDIRFSAGPGQKVGVIGATGCGKSTLAALAARLYDPDEGCVMVGGVDVRRIAPAELRKRVGLVPQESLLFSGTVAENLRFGREDADEGALWAAAKGAEAEEFLRALPGQLDGAVAQRGRNFSGGQRQRLAIARALVLAPDILILDDSTSAVDLITESKLRGAIARRLKDSTLLIIAQRISSIMDCDVILVMDGGRIVAQGSHSELMRDSELYQAIALSQLGEEAMQRA